MRRAIPLVLPVLAAVLLVAGCGSERAGAQGGADGGGEAGGGSASPRGPVSDPGVDGVRITGVSVPSPGAASDVSATYEIANDGTEALTYTILFDFTTSTGEVMANTRQTVRDVEPDRGARGTVAMPPSTVSVHDVTQVKISQVTSVPVDEAPAEPGDCPASGVRVTADEGDAAMGLRVVGLWLENCGTGAYRIDGYPRLSLLDDEREPVDGVRILRGSGGITTAVPGIDDPPRPVTLRPGERARATLVWRNTVGSGTAVDVPYVRVRAKADAAPVMVTPHLDLGTTGKLGVGPWRAER
ncbi:DUF4232 domain-containing protein [Streptomyces sp. ALI-76-A]|uniref:DUF4232 domain-containing protein n=1 Tax=Streptomyces sp. ALI-76-A TaxID=3025736 RepID=UPI00256EA716|nr:DUF4232 domain-containing protein [Streptomyces sp. ALI-76-A]MDL5204315.1 DUF4232 domain-containing protein [Streptomyces sp. ALI-76-A]